MGLFEQTETLLTAMEQNMNLSDQDIALVRNKKEQLPSLIEGIETAWKQIAEKKDFSKEELKPVYDVISGKTRTETAPFEELADALSEPLTPDILSPEELYQWGAELDQLSPRVPGTESMDRTTNYLVEKLRSFGIEAWTEPINFRGVFFHEWSFDLTAPEKRSFTVFPENNVGFGDVEAEIIDIGRGEEQDYDGVDVKGKIVLTDWGELFDHEGPCALRKRYGVLHLYDLAYAHGAAGMIGYFRDTPGNTLKLLEPGIKPVGGSNVWGPVEDGQENQFKLPVLNIGREDAMYIKDTLKKQKAEGHLVIKGVRKVSTTQIVAGVLPGTSSRTIACGAHSCTAFEGAVCDTVGVVGTLALAKYFSQKPKEEREKSMFFFFDSFHVWGNCCQTAITLLDRHKILAGQIDSLIWLDHIGDGREDTIRLTTASDNPVLWPLTALAIAKNGVCPLVLPIAQIWSVCATGAHQRIGIPTITVQAMNDDTLTPEDTWNKFKPEILYRDVVIHVELVQALQKLPVPQDEIREPIGGCGSLFTDLDTPEYPAGEKYEPEPDYPLYVGGGEGPVRILNTEKEKRAFIEGGGQV